MSKPPASSRPPVPPRDIYATDRMPLPEVQEENSDTAWDLWNSLSAKQAVVFADTAPASNLMPMPKGDRRYAATVPAALTGSPPVPAPQTGAASKGVAATEVMVEARRNNRLCPKPLAWKRLYDMLPGKTQPPVTGSAWSSTPSLAKRMCLRDHIEWAETHNCLDAVYSFLKELSEEQWHHMGE